jgi:SAM-dependent methyltransferase
VNALSDACSFYLQVRRKEGRLYADDVVARLPEFAGDDQLSAEWRVRASSAECLTDYLSGSAQPLRILDLGCGNGWLSSRIAAVTGARVAGLDRNPVELAQAARVFGPNERLTWVEADIFQAPFRSGTFDDVVAASAIQYFPDLPRLIRTLAALLRADGEIHILDSPLYPAEELPAARERSRRHYQDLGFPRMAEFYHHHLLSALEPFEPLRLHNPQSPFP